jgi:hypothetical protein
MQRRTYAVDLQYSLFPLNLSGNPDTDPFGVEIYPLATMKIPRDPPTRQSQRESLDSLLYCLPERTERCSTKYVRI